jgi:hypothetical protein
VTSRRFRTRHDALQLFKEARLTLEQISDVIEHLNAIIEDPCKGREISFAAADKTSSLTRWTSSFADM